MNVAYVTDQILPKTATDTKQLVSMASAMGEAGAQVTVVTPRSWFEKPVTSERVAEYYEVKPTFSIHAVPSVYPNIRGIEKLVQGAVGPMTRPAKSADFIYTRTIPILVGALIFGRRPVVYETYRPWPAQNSRSHALFRKIGRHPRFIGAVLHSNLARDSYVQIGVADSKLLTAYNGYDRRHFHNELSIKEAREKCGIDPGKKLVVYSGRMSKKKGLDSILSLAKVMPDVSFLLIGSESQGVVERSAASLPNVDVLNWMPTSEVVTYLYSADVLLIPPTAGPLLDVGNTILPIKTFLYMASQRAILAPSTPDLKELLIDGKNARLVEPDNTDSAASALRDLFEQDDLRERLGKEAARTVSDLTWQNRATKVLGFIDDYFQQRV